MLELERKLVQWLDALRIHIDIPDGDTAIFRNVPVHQQYFNKRATNVLIKRSAPGLSFLVCVDEDLAYLGGEPSLARAFASAKQQRGWRTLCLAHTTGDDFQVVLENTLTALGTDGREPFLNLLPERLPATEARTLLSIFGTNLSQLAQKQPVLAIGREEEIEEVTSCLLRWSQTRFVIIAGESGVGKSNLLQAVASRLLTCKPQWNLVSIDMAALQAGVLFEAEREGLLAQLLDQAATSPKNILALEHLELALGLPRAPLLLAGFLDQGWPLIGTVLPDFLPNLQRPYLTRRLQVTKLAELSVEQTLQILSRLRPTIAAHYQIEIDDSCLPACRRASQPLAGYFPAKALTLLDAAASRSALAGAKVLAADDIYAAAGKLSEERQSESD